MAADLIERMPQNPASPANVWVNEEDEEICVAPAPSGNDNWKNHVFYVQEIAVFAMYHKLSVMTYEYPTGAGLVIYE